MSISSLCLVSGATVLLMPSACQLLASTCSGLVKEPETCFLWQYELVWVSRLDKPEGGFQTGQPEKVW